MTEVISISGSNATFDGTFIATEDLDFQVENESATVNVLKTYNLGDQLGLLNNSIFVDGNNVGIHNSSPTSLLHVGTGWGGSATFNCEVSGTKNVTFSGLSDGDPGVAGRLFTTGSTGMGLGPITGSGTYKIVCVSAG